MKKKLFTILAALLAFVMTFTACGTPTAVEFDVPTYQDDKNLTIGVWNGSRHDLNDAELYNLQKAGVNLLVGAHPTEISEVDLLDRSAEFGINVLLDQRPWNGFVPDYIDRENFWGYCVYDEPFIGHLETLKNMQEEYAKVMQDKMFFVNLLPSGGTGVSYYDYLHSFVHDVNLPVMSYDNYSLMLDEETEEIYIRDTYLFDFDVASHVAQEEDVPLWYTLLTSGHLRYTTPTTTELKWQMYLAMTYGAQALIHYIYATHDTDYKGTIVDMSGNPTEQYYRVKEADNTILSWDHIFMDFTWLATSNVFGTEEETGLLEWTQYDVAIDTFGETLGVTSTHDVIVGHFEDSNKNAGFMVTNVTSPVEDKTANVTVTLNSAYQGALIINEGVETVVALTNGQLNLELEAGLGVFVIPLKAKAN